jgi:FkbM family methyltransferase
MNINFTNLTKLVKPRGVIHVGANTCQELPLYLENEIERRIWIDIDKLNSPKDEFFIYAAISDKSGSHSIFFANNCESSSLLEPIDHIKKYPEIEFSKIPMAVTTITIDELFKEKGWLLENINYLVLDIQGMELRALQGLGKYANHFDVIITEAYTEELYLGCGKLHEIEALLTNYKLIEFAPEVGKGWGDAAFIRKDLIK